ncbi:HET-domain-containing protein [Sordaria brevicollis]|uniref:HET-domain-containing protein n=1 Tax=Sordaria brevicollis TaxID=83679 RepID=A0AAE0UFL0_SORBR|nr:HET-domain-containing protein [Sordaria brevicollis]
MSSSSISRWRRLTSTVYPLTRYCFTCKRFMSRRRYISKIDLLVSARSGCRYCVFLLHACEHFHLFEDPEQGIILVSGRWIHLTPGTRFKGSFDIYTPEGHLPAWRYIVQDANPLDAVLSGSPQTSEAYEFIRTCLRDCDSLHSECQIGDQELPTRLLDLWQKGPHQVVMVETGSLSAGHNTTYIALSYCWGKGQSLKLTSETVEAMKTGIVVSSLPQTLQDAITVTRALGQRYIWIDALCIIQDSPTDWQVESSRMALVYRNAYLTIASATASDVTEGFLRNYRETNDWYREPYHEEWINPQGCSTIVGVRHSNGIYGHSSDYGRFPVLPWSCRGWTLQEQLLSRRLLVYHAYELRWFCQKESRCQCPSNGSSEFEITPRGPLELPRSKIESAELAHDHWRHIAVNYTAREITDVRDRLPAISGLAQGFQRVIQSTYIAGVWSNQIPDLLWSVSYSRLRYALDAYVAPTFSWASISSPLATFATGPIEDRQAFYSSDKWTSGAVMEDGCSIVDGINPLGRVSNGWIKLRGYIFKAAFVDGGGCQKRYAIKSQYIGDHGFDSDTWLENFTTTNEHGDVEISVRRMRQSSPEATPANEPPLTRIREDAVVHLFYVGFRLTRRSYVKFYFLVLGLASDKPGMYERLGLLEFTLWTKSRKKLQKYLSGLMAAAEGHHQLVTIV